MDRLWTLRIFVQVADAGSFTQAARSLQIPRSTVSAALRELEARLSTRLINRTTRTMHLTADGSVYLDWCRRMLADIEETERQFREGESRPRGKLRVDVPSRIARLVIVPALPEFLEHYPHIELEMGVTDRPVDLIHEGLDCALRVGELPDSELVARRIGVLRQGNFASPAYLSRYGTPTTVADLEHHLLVDYASPMAGRVARWEYMEDDRVRTKPMRSVVTVNNADTYIACCRAGLGLIQIPAYDAKALVARGELVEVMPHASPAALPVSAVYPERRYASGRVKVFVEWIASLYDEHMRAA